MAAPPQAGEPCWVAVAREAEQRDERWVARVVAVAAFMIEWIDHE